MGNWVAGYGYGFGLQYMGTCLVFRLFFARAPGVVIGCKEIVHLGH